MSKYIVLYSIILYFISSWTITIHCPLSCELPEPSTPAARWLPHFPPGVRRNVLSPQLPRGFHPGMVKKHMFEIASMQHHTITVAQMSLRLYYSKDFEGK